MSVTLRAQRKPARWAVTQAGIDPAFRRYWQRALAVTIPDQRVNGQPMYGLTTRVATPNTSGLTSSVTESGPALASSGTSQLGLSTNVTRNFARVSCFAVVQLSTLAQSDGASSTYCELAARGSTFRNNTNFAVGLRRFGSGNAATTMFALSRASTTLRGRESSGGITDAEINLGRPVCLSWSMDTAETRFVLAINGIARGTLIDYNLPGAMGTSTDQLTLLTGTSPSSSARPWNASLIALIVADDYWTLEQHRALTRDWFGWMRPVTISLPAAAPPTGFQPAWAARSTVTLQGGRAA